MLKRFDRRLLTILAIVFVQMVGAALILPILPLYALAEFDLSEQVITLIISVFFVAQFLAGPYLGRLSDRIGRLPVLLVSQIGTVLSFATIGFATAPWMLFAARIVDGATGGNIIVAQAYMTDISPKEKRTEALGYIFAVFGLGFIIGPALGGFLSAAYGPRVPFYLAAVVAAVTTLLTWLFLDESLTDAQKARNKSFTKATLSIGEVLRNAPLVMVLLVVFIAQFAMGLIQSTFALYGNAVIFREVPTELVMRNVGLLLATVGATQFLTQSFLLKHLLRRFSEAVLVINANVVRILGSLIFAVAKAPLMAFLGSVIFPIGQAILLPSIQSLATETVEDELRGGVLGIYQSVASLAIIFGTGLGGTLFSVSPAMPFWLATVSGAVAIVPTLLLARKMTVPAIV